MATDKSVQKEKPWLFKKGQSGNPAGRPKGSVSIVTKIKQIFESDPEYFEQYVAEILKDPRMRKEVMEQLDGKPVQPISGADGGALVIQFDNALASRAEKGR